jgi:hypothetical protein
VTSCAGGAWAEGCMSDRFLKRAGSVAQGGSLVHEARVQRVERKPDGERIPPTSPTLFMADGWVALQCNVESVYSRRSILHNGQAYAILEQTCRCAHHTHLGTEAKATLGDVGVMNNSSLVAIGAVIMVVLLGIISYISGFLQVWEFYEKHPVSHRFIALGAVAALILEIAALVVVNTVTSTDAAHYALVR